MVVKTILISILLVVIAGIGLAIKYFNAQKAPQCNRNFNNHENSEITACSSCGAEYDEKCNMEV